MCDFRQVTPLSQMSVGTPSIGVTQGGFVWVKPLPSMPGTGLTMIVPLQNVAVLGQGSRVSLEERNVPHLSSYFSQTVLLQPTGHLLGCLSMCLGKCGPVVGPFIADVLDGWSTVSYYLLASGDRISKQIAQDFISSRS